MIDAELVAKAIDEKQDKDPEVRAEAVTALRRIAQMPRAELVAAFAVLDDQDHRNGARERRSQALDGRLLQLREQDAAPAPAPAEPPHVDAAPHEEPEK